MAERVLSIEDRKRVCDALLKIRALQDRQLRDLYVSELERYLGHGLPAKRYPDALHDLWSLVGAMHDEPDSIRFFVRVIKAFHGEIPAVVELERLIDEVYVPDDILIKLERLIDQIPRELVASVQRPEGNELPSLLVFADMLAHQADGRMALELHRWIDAAGTLAGVSQQDLRAICVSTLERLAFRPTRNEPEPTDPCTGRDALCIGLTSFDGWTGLPFASARANDLAHQLTRLGYRCQRPQSSLSAEALGSVVRQAIAGAQPDDLLVVHVLSHGHVSSSGTLHIVGSDGVHHEFTDVERWLKNIVDASPSAPHTLFLLDICGAGTAARLAWQTRIGEGNRAWVIAACAPDENAYSARLTEATTNILRDLADGRMDIDRSLQHAPLTTVAQRIRREVSRLSTVAQALPQQVTASLMDISSDPPDLAFFPNPRYVMNPRRVVRPKIDLGVTPFLDDLDETLDPRHFLRHALGRHGAADDLGGCFSGRSRELKILAPWLNLQDEVGLRVITGSPGVGKSALIGVLVCAAHPLLRMPTATVWEHIEQAPYVNHRLAAVHARGRTVSEIAASIARQLNLQGSVIEAVGALPAPPVVIVDALDEAVDPVAVMTELVVPLAGIRYSGGPLRLLVGMRPWEEFAPLRELAGDGVLDLDRVPEDRLRRDLEQYVSRLLATDARWDNIDTVGAAHTLARAVAHQLTSTRSAWGAFLVAGLYTHHILSAYPEPISDQAEAARRGNRVPQTLPDVLELDLSTRGHNPWLRPVLTALANARGEGMPASLIRHVAGAPDIDTTLSALDDVRFYVRHSTETDGTALYRLFHQGLTDHLRHAMAEPEVYACLLRSIIPDDDRTVARLHWHLADPYLLRHALDHAPEPNKLLADPGFLVEADPSLIQPRLHGWMREVYAILGATPPSDPRARRQALALSATFLGRPKLAKALVDLAGQPALDTIPLWTERMTDGSSITAVNVYTLDGVSWVIMGTSAGKVWARQIQGTQRLRVETAGVDAIVTAVAGGGGHFAVGFTGGLLVIDGLRVKSPETLKALELGEFGERWLLLVNRHQLVDLATGKWDALSAPLPAVFKPGAAAAAMLTDVSQVCTTSTGELVVRRDGAVTALLTRQDGS